MAKNYRLIWFQHISKAAGTSIVELARANDEIFYPRHKNGNPLKSDGTLIRLWEMDASQLKGFIDHCEKERITFVATEWGAPDFSVLASDPRVVLITCLRDPLKRFISNYYYGFHWGYTDCTSPELYENSNKSIWGSYTRDNYYCRMFSRCHHRPEGITRDHYEVAKRNLSLFDGCVVISGRERFDSIKRLLDWSDRDVVANKNNLDMLSFARQLFAGKLRLLWRRLISPKKKPNDNFTKQFRERNVWDYKLIEASKSRRAEKVLS